MHLAMPVQSCNVLLQTDRLTSFVRCAVDNKETPELWTGEESRACSTYDVALPLRPVAFCSLRRFSATAMFACAARAAYLSRLPWQRPLCTRICVTQTACAPSSGYAGRRCEETAARLSLRLLSSPCTHSCRSWPRLHTSERRPLAGHV